METKMRKVKITTIILAIILITAIAFGGIYIKTQNRMENKVKGYTFGRELEGERVIELSIVKPEAEEETETEDEATENTTEGEKTEEESEIEEDLNIEDCETVKKTIEKRLDNLGAPDYTVSLNKENGTIRVELPEDANTDIYAYFLNASGEVKIVEDETETELLSDSMVEKATYNYTSNMEGAYQVYLELSLSKEGQAKIEEIQNNYAIFAEEVKEIEAAKEAEEEKEETESEATEQTTDTEETTAEETKKIARLTIGGREYDIAKIEKNKIRVAIGEATTNSTSINTNLSAALELTILVDSGKYPVEYEVSENRYEYTDITEKQILYFAIAVAAILLIVFIVFTIKYKTKGLLASISFIGFVSILTILLRYTNVSISIEGIGAIILVLIFNIRINQLILGKVQDTKNVNEALVSTYKDVFLKLVPIIIITLIFCFAGVSNLISFGMIMFWGLVLIAAYNAIVTKTLLKLKESK